MAEDLPARECDAPRNCAHSYLYLQMQKSAGKALSFTMSVSMPMYFFCLGLRSDFSTVIIISSCDTQMKGNLSRHQPVMKVFEDVHPSLSSHTHQSEHLGSN